MPISGREAGDRVRSVVCEVGTRICALPLAAVIETMRPLPVVAVAGVPAFVSGLAIIRGEPVPVVDAARLLGAESTRPARFVTLHAGSRRVALAVDRVLGVRWIDARVLAGMPPLLGDVSRDIVSAVGTLDEHLLLVLDTARVIPPAVWHTLDDAAARSAR